MECSLENKVNNTELPEEVRKDNTQRLYRKLNPQDDTIICQYQRKADDRDYSAPATNLIGNTVVTHYWFGEWVRTPQCDIDLANKEIKRMRKGLNHASEAFKAFENPIDKPKKQRTLKCVSRATSRQEQIDELEKFLAKMKAQARDLEGEGNE